MTIVSLKYSVLVSLSFLESIDNLFVPRNNWVFYFFHSAPGAWPKRLYINFFLAHACVRTSWNTFIMTPKKNVNDKEYNFKA